MQAASVTTPDETEAAWRFFLFNWIVVGTLAAMLAFSVLVTDFSIAPVGVLIAVGYVGLYAGFAHANARSPRDAIRKSCSCSAPPRRSC